MRQLTILTLAVTLIFTACQSKTKDNTTENNAPQRFFSDESFWNQPVAANAESDPRSDKWIAMLEKEPTGNNIGINTTKWTIPVFEVDSTTPVYDVKLHYLSPEEKENWNSKREHFGHGPGFSPVPIPDNAKPDPQNDAHIAFIDRERGLAWDSWGMRKRPDGTWESNTGMKYDLYGSGVFNTGALDVVNGESVHFHGPGRAAGVPVIAGLIMYNEVNTGEIRHKLAMACRYSAFQEFVYPAAWTDGYTQGGIPEGAVVQLDPKLDLSRFDLTNGEKVVAKALQHYGAVIVDVAQGSPLYAENLNYDSTRTWNGILREWDGGINSIPVKYYRVLKVENAVHKGDARSRSNGYWDNDKSE
ncbi:MAG TPA: hypothetical protein VE870_09420 [Bacteroidales bacterium]|nr:hypothetical protein [Bacteroidales bacterium]